MPTDYNSLDYLIFVVYPVKYRVFKNPIRLKASFVLSENVSISVA
jgi:hypothetical protein